MASYIRLSEQAGEETVVGPEDVTLSLNTWPVGVPTAIVSVYNDTDGNAFVCAAGTVTGGPNGRLIPAGGSLTIGPIRRSEGALVIHVEGSGDIWYSFNLIGSEG